MDFFKDLTACCLRKIHYGFEYINMFKVLEWEKTFHTSRNQKISGVTILISDKHGSLNKGLKITTIQ